MLHSVKRSGISLAIHMKFDGRLSFVLLTPVRTFGGWNYRSIPHTIVSHEFGMCVLSKFLTFFYAAIFCTSWPTEWHGHFARSAGAACFRMPGTFTFELLPRDTCKHTPSFPRFWQTALFQRHPAVMGPIGRKRLSVLTALAVHVSANLLGSSSMIASLLSKTAGFAVDVAKWRSRVSALSLVAASQLSFSSFCLAFLFTFVVICLHWALPAV